MDSRKRIAIRAEIDALLADLGEKLGLGIKTTGGMKYTDTDFTITLQVAEKNGSGEVLTREAELYRRMAHYDGLPGATLGWSFTSGGKTFTITGYNHKARKMPIMARGPDGRIYKFSATGLASALRSQKPREWAAAVAADPKLKDRG